MKLPVPFDGDLLNVVIETPAGSRNKYEYVPENDFFRLKKILPSGTIFPADFGFIPSTMGEDNMPVDVLVLMEAPACTGAVIKCRCLGVIQAEQKEDGKKFRNDRVIAVAEESLTFADLESIKDLNDHLVNEIIHFFEYYNEMAGKKFKFLGLKDQKTAMRMIKSKLVKNKSS